MAVIVPSSLFDDPDAAGHQVVADAAELVAGNAVFPRLGGREGDDLLVSRVNRDVDVDGLEREAVLPVHRREMEAVALPLLQFEDRPPLPQPGEKIDVLADRRSHDGNAHLVADL